jgi:hypothetical protein
VPVVLVGAFLEVLGVLRGEESLVVDDDAALAEFVEVLVERLGALVAVDGTLALVAGEGVTQREEAATSSPAARTST